MSIQNTFQQIYIFGIVFIEWNMSMNGRTAVRMCFIFWCHGKTTVFYKLMLVGYCDSRAYKLPAGWRLSITLCITLQCSNQNYWHNYYIISDKVVYIILNSKLLQILDNSKSLIQLFVLNFDCFNGTTWKILFQL